MKQSRAHSLAPMPPDAAPDQEPADPLERWLRCGCLYGGACQENARCIYRKTTRPSIKPECQLDDVTLPS